MTLPSQNIPPQSSSSKNKTQRTPKKKNEAIPTTLPKRIVDLTIKREHKPVSEVAPMFGLPRSTVDSIKDSYRENGEVVVKQRGEEHSEYLIEILGEDCTLTLELMREKLYERFSDLQEKGIKFSGLYQQSMKNIGLTLKITKDVEERRNDPDAIEGRRKIVESLPGLGVAYVANCIFVDETGLYAYIIRQQG
ncbi:Homeodomain-like DNA binding domain-containing transcription factor [Phycomyces blakesleeanus NRRL 1555(-)]|uniref:Homeodomain-like DNA binding domain-containing transcription factor n=1 Tax=Phycomyces blakesleeanus (strain ATCC 8743b / DSM 1359 / FGSC 10004 / NBRC 33097 / NRRL 1555) TaxID=763407 RepID=A0A162V4U1_PHYB8|nr:Homeodomain-like DNA binding domain-containing transcription factor [Phycomyces blakesleeanus NRRL 1555(-)]OAD79962.1 Homeodomain-like DNA binding domain-containing transcription factor [Phycomyces blakesleeanus NRRL 1555(-)]|eukprot:XP_018298002.1 Homeodomain-like DNA binding domain-containing transcription factor [Phycomyces blakesleeanus NRRL 1555(-)]